MLPFTPLILKGIAMMLWITTSSQDRYFWARCYLVQAFLFPAPLRRLDAWAGSPSWRRLDSSPWPPYASPGWGIGSAQRCFTPKHVVGETRGAVIPFPCESKKKRAALPRAEDPVGPGLLGKAVPVPDPLGAQARDSRRVASADPPRGCAHSWPPALSWDLLFSRTTVSHQARRNSIISGTYTSETPLNWAEVTFEREKGRVQWSRSFLLRTLASLG